MFPFGGAFYESPSTWPVIMTRNENESCFFFFFFVLRRRTVPLPLRAFKSP
jgi:hypothetical protein